MSRFTSQVRPRRPGGARRLPGSCRSARSRCRRGSLGAGCRARRGMAAPSPGLLGAALASERIAFTNYTANQGADIWTMGRLGGTPAQLTTFAGLDFDPSWSPDHKHMAFSRMRTGYPDIFVMDADGTNKHWARSATFQGNIDMPSWSPDGTNLLVRAQFQGCLCIARLDLATGNLALVAPSGLFGIRATIRSTTRPELRSTSSTTATRLSSGSPRAGR